MISLKELAQTYNKIFMRMQINKPFSAVNVDTLPSDLQNVFARNVVFTHSAVYVTLF